MFKFFKSKTWDTFTLCLSVLVFSYFFIYINARNYIKTADYHWEEKQILNDPTLTINASAHSSRRSFSKSYYLDIYQDTDIFAKVSCDFPLDKYCKQLYDQSTTLPIQNLKYKEAISPSAQNLVRIVRSFEIIENNHIKTIYNDESALPKKKQKNIKLIYLVIGFLVSLPAYIWVIRKWFLIDQKDFTPETLWECFFLKLGLAVCIIAMPILLFFEIRSLY